ncbi:trypsin-like peptidase domain-containing protein [Microbispora sp. NBRC 16548]|uniref:trypsin-like peptidase domain-containing protein n=1 Tax=Microbispora sp. NBRC 16548 TaxID=3030994 RepID=UPI00332C8E57
MRYGPGTCDLPGPSGRSLAAALDDGRRFAARVVAFDPEADAAVLRAPGLAAQPLRLTRAARTAAVVVGYPQGAAVPAVLPATVRPDQPAGKASEPESRSPITWPGAAGRATARRPRHGTARPR